MLELEHYSGSSTPEHYKLDRRISCASSHPSEISTYNSLVLLPPDLAQPVESPEDQRKAVFPFVC